MIYSYKITKYKPSSTPNVISLDWTSFSDIGNIVTEEEYLLVEKEYIETVINICRCMNVNSLIINNLELYSYNIDFHEGQIVEMENIHNLIQMILRENLWCKLISNKCEFHFGYDYYMYFVSYKLPSHCLKQISDKLYAEKCMSPYLCVENE
jgi:hypothetical protein